MANPTIIIDAGHGGYDNGAFDNGRLEKDDNLRLALAVGNLLEQDGFPVVYTRTTDVYQRPIDKARIANESGGDYFVSFHRNASPNRNTYSGVQTLVYADEGIKSALARKINDNLNAVGFADLGVPERKNLVVLKRTDMPAVLIETGFINTDADNELFDSRFDDIASAIASAIEETVGEETGSREYGVQVGLFRRYENALYQATVLRNEGYYVDIAEQDPYYAVVVGREQSIEGARELERDLQQAGYDTLIVNL